jgi:hypothetical protein
MEEEDQRRGGAAMTAGPWKDREDWERWWRQNSITHNRLAVTDPAEWERITQAIEKFQRENPR